MRNYRIHLDSPRVIEAGDVYLLIRGWWLGPLAPPEIRVSLGDSSALQLLATREQRPDVALAHTRSPSGGFRCLLDFAKVETACGLKSGALPICVSLGDGVSQVFEIPGGDLLGANREAALEAKRHKLARLAGMLREPFSRESALPVRCLSPEQARLFDVDPTPNVSSFEYDETAGALIREAVQKDGMVLDCGAGFRAREHRHVVCAEIADYPSTDVLCANQELPFVDNAFDVVLSLAVLEHVTDPFRSAAELVRVLKPGGTLYCVAPFLQPEHGYPHHYFGMTREGLRALFRDKGEIVRHSVENGNGHPMLSLHWMLQSYLQGLPPRAAARFRRLRVGDLLKRPAAAWVGQDVGAALSPEKKWELASTTSLVLRK